MSREEFERRYGAIVFTCPTCGRGATVSPTLPVPADAPAWVCRGCAFDSGDPATNAEFKAIFGK